MNISRFFLWSTLTGMAIAGGLFVSDQRIVKTSGVNGVAIKTGEPLRLGVVLSDVPGTTEINQTISHTLQVARNQVNQCGGINQTPVFLTMDDAVVKKDKTGRLVSKQHPQNVAEAIEQEAQSMNYLIQAKDVHGVIATFTPEPKSYGLTSKALDAAIDFKIPTFSPTNPQPLLSISDNSPFDRFRLELSKMDSSRGNRYGSKDSTDKAKDRFKGGNFQRQAKKTQYWSRITMSDRQHLMMVAQLAHQNKWNRIVTIGPDSDRSAYLETLLKETVEAWTGIVIPAEQFLRYQVESSEGISEPTLSLGEDAPLNPPSESNSTSPESSVSEPSVQVTLDTDALIEQAPDAIILFLEPQMFSNLSWSSFTQANAPSTPPSTPSNVEPSSLYPQIPELSSTDRVPINPNSPEPTSPKLSAPLLQSVSQANLLTQNVGQSNPLLIIGSSLMSQLQTAVDLEQTPIVMGNGLDVRILLAQAKQISDRMDDYQGAIAIENATDSPQALSSESLTHPLANLHGILPLPDQPPYSVLSQPQHTLQSYRNTVLNSAIAPATWDAAVLLMLAAEAAGHNRKDAIQENLRNVSNPPGMEVTDVCEALELIRQGERINYQGISGRVDLDGWGNVNPPQTYQFWEITSTGTLKTIEHLEWAEPSSFPQ
ncbi:MAG: hypothetical protein AAGD25_28370 [Cyanobacteria bacterium P01_F01_bin.150]